MIRKITIRNFGSNRKLDIALDERITCLTGESYTGKSWAVRAVKWPALNRPSGVSFIRWGSKRSTVSAETGKHKVTRRRSKTENTYIVDGTPLKAFGNNVPVKVQRILNLSDLNFQTQQEMPHGAGPLFWFALSPGEVAKRLNKIVNLDLIDRTLGNLGKSVHRAKVELDVCRDRRKEARERAEELAFVPEMVLEWKEAKALSEQAEKLKEQEESLSTLLKDIGEQQQSIKGKRELLKQMDSELSELEALRAKIIEIDKDERALSQMLGEIERLEQDQKESMEELGMAKKQYEKALENRCPLCGNQRKSN